MTSSFPDDEKFGMTSQIRRAALSIPANIAEGHGRSSDADFVRFLFMSLGSVKELETILDIAQELNYLDSAADMLRKLTEESKMLASLISTLKG